MGKLEVVRRRMKERERKRLIYKRSSSYEEGVGCSEIFKDQGSTPTPARGEPTRSPGQRLSCDPKSAGSKIVCCTG